MNAVTKPEGTVAAAADTFDPYAAYGQAAAAVSKTYMTFGKGEFQLGQNKEEVPLGTRFIAGVSHLRIGWKKWANKTVVDDRMNYLVDPETGKVFSAGPRGALGDTDQSLWERDAAGDRVDPWHLHNELPLRGLETGDAFVFTTSGKTSIAAIGELCKEYSKQYRQRPGQAPVIELGRGSYVHNKYGKTYVPVFTIVDWVLENPAAPQNATLAPAPADARASATPAPAEPPTPQEPEKPRRTRF